MSFIKSLFGGKTKGEKANDAAYQSSFMPIVQQGSKYTGEYHDLATPVLKQATDTINPVTTYFTNILKGGPAMMDELSPELTAEANAYKNVSASSAFAPRGAGQVSRQGQLDTQHLSDIASILAKGRTGAASGLMQSSGILAQLGLGEGGLSNQESGTIGSLLNQFRQGNLQEYQSRMQSIANIMGAIGSIVGGVVAPGSSSIMSILKGGGGNPNAGGGAPGGFPNTPPIFDSPISRPNPFSGFGSFGPSFA